MKVGAFTLERPLGTGGMGQVWSASHRSGARAAVKLLRADAVHDDLDAEVRAMAALRHPGIVAVYDTGIVRTDEARRSDRALRADTRWIAMEELEGGTLQARADQLPPTAVARVLQELLDALAHAHAHRLLHRDLKPANLLFDRRGRLRITDFGLVHRTEADPAALLATTASGTPTWMAPEQFLGDWRQFGPWTDLYAVGCLAWALACGRRPFPKGTAPDMLRARQAGPPSLRPRWPVPDGYEAWCHRLMRFSPIERYGDAASAAADFSKLVFPDAPVSTTAPDPDALASLSGQTTVLAPVALSRRVLVGGSSFPPRQQPVPSSWRPHRRAEAPGPLPAVGLGLFALRQPHLVARVAERDLLWEQLRAVAAGAGPRVVQLAGSPGVGRGALGRWLLRRVHEIGVAQPLWVRFGAVASPALGWAPMWRTELALHGLTGAAMREAAATRGAHVGLSPDLAHRLASWLDPDEPKQSNAEAAALCSEALAAMARRRPVVVLVEQAHQGGRGAGLAKLSPEARVLVVATTPEAASLVEPLQADERLLVPPLEEAAIEELLTQLLPMEPASARALAAVCGGVPLLAQLLLGDLVEEARLSDGPAGYRAPARLPPRGQLWSRRLARLLPKGQDRERLEAAAVLGEVVAVDEWLATTGDHAGKLRPLLQELLWHGLVREDGARERFAFVHEGLREALLRDATAAGRAAYHHRRVEAWLATGPRTTERSLRRAHHLAAAGQPVEALTQRALAYQNIDDVFSFSECLAGLDDVLSTLRALSVPESDPAWARPRHIRMRFLFEQGRPEARGLLEQLEKDAHRHGWREVEHRCITDRADLAMDEVRLGDADALVRRALQVMDPTGLPAAAAICTLATTRALQGRFTEAVALLHRARELYTLPFHRMLMSTHRASYLARLGSLEDARAELEPVRTVLKEDDGYDWVRGNLHQADAALAEVDGDLATAEARMADAEACFRALRQTYAGDTIGLVGCAVSLLAGSEHRAARAAELVERLPAHQGHAIRALGLLIDGTLRPQRIDEAFWAHVDRGLGPDGAVDPHAAAVALLLGDRLAAEGSQGAEAAERAWTLALQQLQRLEGSDPAPAWERLT